MYSVMMEELTWLEYNERVREGAPILTVVGSTEQHGPHLPLGTDVFQGMAIARTVAEQIGGIVAPPISYGYKSQPRSGGGQTFGGTTSLDAMTLISLVRDLIRELIRHGARRLVFINGHYENAMCLAEGIDLALRDNAVSDARIVVVHWWDLINQVTIDEIFDGQFPGWALEHAAVVETSLTWAIRSDLVRVDRMKDDRMDQFPAYDIYPLPPNMVPRSGVLSPVHRASAEHGRRILAEIVEAIVKLVKTEFPILKKE